MWVCVGFRKGSIAQWPFSNKVSALPHLMPFKASQDDKTKKIVSGPITAGLLSIFSQDALESTQKCSAGEPQVGCYLFSVTLYIYLALN